MNIVNLIKKNNLKIYLITALIVLAALFYIYKLWDKDLKVGLSYSYDAIYQMKQIKDVTLGHFPYSDSQTGMPAMHQNWDYPNFEVFNWLIIAVFSLFTSEPGLIMNLFYMLGFVLSALSALFVFRYFKVSDFFAVAASVIFAFLPYHFYREILHYYLTFYWYIPFIFLICYWFIYDELGFFSVTNKKIKIIITRKNVFAAGVLAIIIASDFYNAFFTIIFLLTSQLIKIMLKQKFSIYKLLSGLGIFLVIMLIVGYLQYLPTSIYEAANGKNLELINRSSVEGEYWALKFYRLFIPLTHNFGLEKISEIKAGHSYFFNQGAMTEYLGVVSILGFILMIFYFISRFFNKNELPAKQANQFYKIMDVLSFFSVTVILVGVPTMLGTMVAFFFDLIRDYSRLSLFLAFFSIFALVLFANEFQLKLKHRLKKAYWFLFMFLITAFFIIGFFEQTHKADEMKYYLVGQQNQDVFIRQDKAKNQTFYRDRDFIAKIEGIMPDGSMIFQLPYVQYPEVPRKQDLLDYDHFRAYLHSKKLKWSYGAFKGRAIDIWQRSVAAKSAQDFINEIIIAGFNGIYINRNGYADRGNKIVEEIKTMTGITPIVSSDDELLFFNLNDFKKNILASKNTAYIEDYKNRIFGNLALNMWISKNDDAYYYKGWSKAEKYYRWSEKNPSVLAFSFVMPKDAKQDEYYLVLKIETTLGEQNVTVRFDKKNFGTKKISGKTDFILPIKEYMLHNKAYSNGKKHFVEFILPDAKSPHSQDLRLLGIALNKWGIFDKEYYQNLNNFEALKAKQYYVLNNWLSKNDAIFLIDGWSQEEPEFRWTNGKRSRIKFSIPQGSDLKDKQYQLVFKVALTLGKQRADVMINNRSIGTLAMDQSGQFSVAFNSEVLNSKEPNYIDLILPDAKKPGSNDSRLLGIAITEWGIFQKP